MLLHNFTMIGRALGTKKVIVRNFGLSFALKYLELKMQYRSLILKKVVIDGQTKFSEDNPQLAAFPYVNGGLFADEAIKILPFRKRQKKSRRNLKYSSGLRLPNTVIYCM